jgi:hypothetical protein
VKRLVVILFVMLMATVLGWIWVYGASGDTACIELYPDLPEGTAFQQTGPPARSASTSFRTVARRDGAGSPRAD